PRNSRSRTRCGRGRQDRAWWRIISAGARTPPPLNLRSMVPLPTSCARREEFRSPGPVFVDVAPASGDHLRLGAFQRRAARVDPFEQSGIQFFVETSVASAANGPDMGFVVDLLMFHLHSSFAPSPVRPWRQDLRCRRGGKGSPGALANPRPAEWKRGRRPAVAARELGLVGDSAMLDAIREAGVRRLAAEIEIRLARVADRPFADAVVEVEQAGLVGDLRAWLGRDQAARRRGRDRRLLLSRTLTDEAAGADRAILHLRTRAVRSRGMGSRRRGRRGRWSGGPRRLGPERGFARGSGSDRRRLAHFLLVARFHRRRALLEAETMGLADDGIAADPAELVGDLARGRAFVPHLLQALDPVFGPGHAQN